MQTYEAIAETKMLCNANNNIISIQDSKPIIRPVQDSLIGAYLLTRYKSDYELEDGNELKLKMLFFDMTLVGSRYVKGKFIPLYNQEKMDDIQRVFKKFNVDKSIYGGHALISLIFPSDFFYEKKNEINPDEPIVKIYNGVLYSGTLDKSVVGSSNGSIIHVLHKEYCSETAVNFINNIQFIANNWLARRGFYVGLEDCMFGSSKIVDLINEKIDKCFENAKGIEETTQDPKIREARILDKLSEASNIGAYISKKAMSSDNNFLISVQSGAKGEIFNITQLVCALGQQYIEGDRIPCSLSNNTRTLPHYPTEQNDSIRERYKCVGFVCSSFMKGLDPDEAYLHAMGGRIGIIGTALKTAVTGILNVV